MGLPLGKFSKLCSFSIFIIAVVNMRFLEMGPFFFLNFDFPGFRLEHACISVITSVHGSRKLKSD